MTPIYPSKEEILQQLKVKFRSEFSIFMLSSSFSTYDDIIEKLLQHVNDIVLKKQKQI